MENLKKTVCVVYATVSGNTEVVVDYMTDKLKEEFDFKVFRAELINFSVIEQNKYFIFATSTWEHGEINPYFHKVLDKIKDGDMSGKLAAFIGLGDIRYEKVEFCGGAYILRDAFVKSGGEEITNMLKINGEPYEFLDSLVLRWLDTLVDAFEKYE